MTITVLDNMEYGSDAAAQAGYVSNAYDVDDYTKILIHADNVIRNESNSGLAITTYGNIQTSSNQSKFGGGSCLLDGSGDYLTFPMSSHLDFGSGDFTIECWFKFSSLPTGNAYNSGQYILSNGPNYADAGFDLILGATEIVFNLNYYSSTIIRGKYIPDTNWHHLAIVRSGNVFYAFIDGYLVGSGYSTALMTTWTGPWCIGRCEATGESTGYFNGYIDEYRISKGISRFSPGTITVPTAQYSDDSYTKLLLHMDGSDGSTTFTDSSSNNRTVSVYGNTQIDTDYYVFNGASGKFDGSSDYLTVPYTSDFAFGTDDFTIDCWIKMDAMPTSDAWPSNWSSHMSIAGIGSPDAGDGCNLLLGQTQLILQSNDAVFIKGTHGISTGSWHHVAVSRNDNRFFLFVDGTLVGGAHSNASMGTGNGVYIGCETGQGAWFNGWIDELRVSKGIARWTANFTPPESAYSSDSFLSDYSEPTTITEGSYSLKAIAAQTTSLNKTLTRTITTPINLTSHAYIIGKIRSNRTGSNIKIGFHDSGGITTEVTPNIATADTWQTIQLDISAVSDANKDAIDQIIITIVNADADNTFYLDNFFAVTAADYALGVQASKVVAYAVLSVPDALNVSKAVAYAVLGPYVEPESGSGPMMWIF